MPDEGSVWDDGPQYPDLWPAPSGDSVDPTDPADQTPTAPSPVDLDAVEPAAEPVVAGSAAQSRHASGGWWRGRFLGLAAWIWLGMLAVVVAVLILLFAIGDGDDPERAEATPPIATGPAISTLPTVPETVATGTVPEVAPPTSVPAVSAPDTPAPTSTQPPATAAPTTVPTTVAPTTVAPTTVAPTTAAPTTSRAPAPPGNGPAVTIVGRVGPCDFGAECLVAGFTIDGFDPRPTEFVCEFGDGSRYTFRFDSQGVERACATGNPDGSITIEVDGVRSETFRRP